MFIIQCTSSTVHLLSMFIIQCMPLRAAAAPTPILPGALASPAFMASQSDASDLPAKRAKPDVGDELEWVEGEGEESLGGVGRTLVAVTPPDSDLDVAARKRHYATMDYQAKKLSPEALAVYTATKGCHKKRAKLMTVFLEQGMDLGMACEVFQLTEQALD